MVKMRIQKDANNYLRLLLSEGAKTPIDDDEVKVELPPYFDKKKFKRGQKFHGEFATSIGFALFTGFLASMAVPTFRDVLEYTKNSSTPLLAYKRYVSTVLYELNWFGYDLKPGTLCWKSLESVKKHHAFVNRKVKKAGIGFVSQKDMAIGQFSFLGFVLLKWQQLGITYNRQNFEAFAHCWRVIGSVLGIQERFNVCTDSLDETISRLEAISSGILRQALQRETESFRTMSKTVIEAFTALVPTIDYEVVMYITKHLAEVPDYAYSVQPSRREKEVLAELGMRRRIKLLVMMKVIFGNLLHLAVFRFVFNIIYVVQMFMVRYFPIFAIWKFGYKNAIVKI